MVWNSPFFVTFLIVVVTLKCTIYYMLLSWRNSCQMPVAPPVCVSFTIIFLIWNLELFGRFIECRTFCVRIQFTLFSWCVQCFFINIVQCYHITFVRVVLVWSFVISHIVWFQIAKAAYQFWRIGRIVMIGCQTFFREVSVLIVCWTIIQHTTSRIIASAECRGFFIEEFRLTAHLLTNPDTNILRNCRGIPADFIITDFAISIQVSVSRHARFDQRTVVFKSFPGVWFLVYVCKHIGMSIPCISTIRTCLASFTFNRKIFTLLIIDSLATVSSDASSFASVVEGLNVILGQAILSFSENASAIITGFNLISNIEGTLINIIHILIPCEILVIVLTDKACCIDILSFTVTFCPDSSWICIIIEIFQEFLYSVEITRIFRARITACNTSVRFICAVFTARTVSAAFDCKLNPTCIYIVRFTNSCFAHVDYVGMITQGINLIEIAFTSSFQLLDIFLIEAHYHVLIVTVECHILTSSTIFQNHAFGTWLICSWFFLGFYDDFIYTCYCDVVGVFAVTLYIIVVFIFSTVAQMNIVGNVGTSGSTVFGFFILTF